MKSIRYHIATKLVWIVMAIHLLNFSVDPPDAILYSTPQDLSQNDMKSAVELVLVYFFDFDDRLSSQGKQDNAEGVLFIDIDFFEKWRPSKIKNPLSDYLCKFPIWNVNGKDLFNPIKDSQPPELPQSV